MLWQGAGRGTRPSTFCWLSSSAVGLGAAQAAESRPRRAGAAVAAMLASRPAAGQARGP